MPQRGISLIELIMFVVIIAFGLAGILVVMNQVMRHSADPLVHKQAIAAAESLLEEIELQDFVSQSGVTNAVTQNNRAKEYHVVKDYNGFATVGIFPVSGVAIAGLESYSASVTVTDAGLGGIAAGSAVLITVTVTNLLGEPPIRLSGYRTAY
jgi:MSHA pilin protein MshD